MAKVLYLSIFDNSKVLSNGVMKKINLHIDCLKSYGNEVDYAFTDGTNVFFHTPNETILLGEKKYNGYLYFNRLMFLCKQAIKKRKIKYDYIYIRYVAFSFRGFSCLKYLSKICKGIYLEFPTFFIPKKNPKNFIKYYFNKHLHKYVYKAVVDSLDKTAYGMETLRVINGTDLSKIKPRIPTYSPVINVVLMAYLQDYHGVDKIIHATKNYYENEGKREILFHIVGEGPMFRKYVSECKKQNVENRIIFYGNLSGKPLDDVLNKCEIGISSLSNKEIGVTCSSTLKSKEYLAKGLPVLSDTMLDVFVDNPKYFFYQLKESFNINELISFYDYVYLKRDKMQVINDIRRFADKTCNMYKVFEIVNNDYLMHLANIEVKK